MELFKNVSRQWRSILIMPCAILMMACGNDDDVSKTWTPIYNISQLYYQEQETTTTENNLKITRDETGRVIYVGAFSAGQDDVEKLMGAPSSFEDIQYLFPLSEVLPDLTERRRESGSLGRATRL